MPRSHHITYLLGKPNQKLHIILSMVIAKTASRNIAYKTDKLADSVLAAQSTVLVLAWESALF